MKQYLGHFLIAICFLGQAMGQDSLALGEWETHLPKRIASWVTQSDDHIFISTGLSIITLTVDDLNPSFIDRVDGLSETNIDRLEYDPINDQLIVIYNNGNLDFIKDDAVINVSAIKNNPNITGQRMVQDVHIDGSNLFLSTSFGLVQLDLSTLEFGFTLFIDGGSNSVTTDNDKLYLGLDEGLYSISKNDFNPQDFTRWTKVGLEAGLPDIYEASHVEFANDKIYVVADDELFEQDGAEFQYLELEIPVDFAIQYLNETFGELIVGLRESSSKSEARLIKADGTIANSPRTCLNRTRYGVQDRKGRFWYADEWRGIRYTSGFSFGCQQLTFDSPLSQDVSHIAVDGDRVIFASGGATDNYGPLNKNEGIYLLEDGDWTNVQQDEFPEIKENKFENLLAVAPNPDGSSVAVASYSAGVMIYNYEDQSLSFKDDNNSAIQTTFGDQRQRIAFVKYDEEGNLWCSNFGAPEPIVVFTPDGNSFSFDVPGTTNLAKFEIDDNGYIWFLQIDNSAGVLVYNHNNTINDPTDDQYKIFNTSNSELPTFLVNSIKKDLDGDIWVGTGEGPVVFECDPFSDNCRGSRRKGEGDGFGDFLLRFEDITALGIDGANRKWFGSRNGIFVQSADAETFIEKFTVENSPLLDNTILDMDFDPVTGRMYIATAEGLQSVRTFTTGANRRHSADVYAFPNPVRPGYSGPIAIKGLGQDANVKITDINGVLIYETEALGGQAIWDGNDYNGRRAAPGVYLVFSTSEVSFDEVDAMVTKIMVVE